MSIPFARCSQRFNDAHCTNIPGRVADELERTGWKPQRGQRIAITAGSRGINAIDIVLRAIVDWLKSQDAEPIIIPAMGSHGGGTAAGQTTVLAEYGIDAERMGCAIRSNMATVELPRGESPIPVVMDAEAAACDGVILVNRIKPHTDYHGDYESGLMKMAAIGLGKQVQAEAIHSYGIHGLKQLMPIIGRQVIRHGKVVLGLGLIENAYDRLHTVRGIRPDQIADEEPRLLTRAKDLMPRLPVDKLDVLLVDRMGKNISGVGIDTNIIGRLRIHGENEPSRPDIRMIVCHGLTPESHGNACGVGLADVITANLEAAINREATYTNVRTAGLLSRAVLPMVAATDRDAWALAQRGAWVTEPNQVKALRIQDSLHLDRFWVSPALLPLIRELPHCAVEAEGLSLHDGEALTPFS